MKRFLEVLTPVVIIVGIVGVCVGLDMCKAHYVYGDATCALAKCVKVHQ